MDIPKTVKIKKIVTENQRVKTFILDDKVEALPGQFIMVWLPRIDEKPFSIVNNCPLTITVQKVGPFTEKLDALKEGEKIGWRGPYGKGTFKIKGKKILLVAGGCGAAPLLFLAQEANKKGIFIDLVMGAKSRENLFFQNEFSGLSINNQVCTDDGTAGFKGYTTEKVTQLLKQNKYDQVYACGPEVMLFALRKILDQKGLPYQFSLERYMKCGLGICDQCSINGQLVCKDGPVFNHKQIKKLSDFGKTKRLPDGKKVPL